MKYPKALIALVVAAACIGTAANIAAQTRQVTAPAANAAVASTDTAPNTELQRVVAVVNNQSITFAEVDPKARDFLDNVNKAMADVRRRALDEQINQRLLDAEAKKRGVSSDQLYDAEIAKRITDPADAEIKAAYDQNRDQFNHAELDAVHPQLVGYLRRERERQLAADFFGRLRANYPVAMSAADVNASNLAPATVLATIAGNSVTAQTINERIKPALYDLRLKAYEAERQAIDVKINDMLLTAEAKKRNTTPEEMYRAEVASKVQPPTDAEVTKFYEVNKANIKGDFATVHADIAAYLQQEKARQLENALIARLRAGGNVRVLLTEPEAPVQNINTENAAAHGDTNAPVTVVEFTDFQCPACGATYPVIEEALKPYGNRVRFVVRNYPLPQHAQAFKSAEAAAAAKEQGKFFEYAAILFKNQSALDVPSLKKYASDLKLDRARFDAALDNGNYTATVRRDIADGDLYGINATPTLFINGVRLNGLSAATIQAAIDRAFTQKGQTIPVRATK